ncbi:unnamed protein product [Cochlearia groenlandica]
MKYFTTLMFITFVVIAMSCLGPISATTRGGFGEVAQTCTPTQLMPCLQAITTGGDPTKECCDNLNAQKPCLCGYIKNPDFSMYVSSPNAKKVLKACNIPDPSC